MFLFYELSFFGKGVTIQGGTLFKEIRYISGSPEFNSKFLNYEFEFSQFVQIFLLFFRQKQSGKFRIRSFWKFDVGSYQMGKIIAKLCFLILECD